MKQEGDAESDTYNKRRKFSHPPHKHRNDVVEPGLKGFLCSCNFQEKMCIREAYNILNEYADKLLINEKTASVEEETKSTDTDELQDEIESLKSVTKKHQRFQVVKSGTKNFLFIRTSIDDPVKLVESIVADIYETKEQKTRFLLRLIPVEVTCKAYINDIKKAIEPLLEKYFTDVPKSFSINFNHRNNHDLSKSDVIKIVAEMVAKKRDDHKVDLTNAEVSIVIEVVRNYAFLSVVPNFFKYKKYNLLTICDGQNSSKCDTATLDAVANDEAVTENNE